MTIFPEDADRQVFIRMLELVVGKFALALHGFVLMLNHYHLLITATDADQMADSMDALAWRYARYFNRKYERTGTMWESRYYSKVIDSEEYLLCCLRYIEQNPVRASVVATPEQYRWSSYHSHAGEQRVQFLTDHAVYLALGSCPAERAAAYRVICGTNLTDDELLTVRVAQ